MNKRRFSQRKRVAFDGRGCVRSQIPKLNQQGIFKVAIKIFQKVEHDFQVITPNGKLLQIEVGKSPFS